MTQCVYVAVNDHVSGLKIGMTTGGPQGVRERIRSFKSTGTPGSYRCVYAAEVSNAYALEKDLHQFLSEYRLDPKREFFHIDVSLVKYLIDVRTRGEVVDVTGVVNRQERNLNKGFSYESAPDFTGHFMRQNLNSLTSLPDQAHLPPLEKEFYSNPELWARYNISKQSFYTRIEATSVRSQIRRANRCWWTLEQVKVLDRVHTLMLSGIPLREITEILTNEKSEARDAN